MLAVSRPAATISLSRMPTPPLPAIAVSTSLPRGPLVVVVGHATSGVVGVPAAVDKAYAKRFGSDVAALAEDERIDEPAQEPPGVPSQGVVKDPAPAAHDLPERGIHPRRAEPTRHGHADRS